MRVVGISGSLRRRSYNGALLRAAAAEMPATAEFHEWRGLATLPSFDEDLDGSFAPPPVHYLRRALVDADAVLFATPEYNGSIPGGLKNALDWASPPPRDNPLHAKPAAVIGASTGRFGAIWAQAELRKVLLAIGADVLDSPLPVPSAATAFTFGGRLRDPQLAGVLQSIVNELVRRGSGLAAA